MTIKQKEYDVKLLIKQLEVEVGRPMTAHAASNTISVLLKWVEKSIVLSKSKVDDVILALYPALVKFISTKIDLKEFVGDFELKKAWDIDELLKQLELNGLVIAETSIVRTIEICLGWVKDSALISDNPYDDIVVVVIPVVLEPLNKAVNSISKNIESRIELPAAKKSILTSLKSNKSK